MTESKLPWKYKTNNHSYEFILDADGEIILGFEEYDVFTAEEDDLKLIVESVNNAARYKEALEAAIDFIDKHPADPDINEIQADAYSKYLDKRQALKENTK